MKTVIGSDHAGHYLKVELMEHLRQSGHEVVDVGNHDPAPVDFPNIARALCSMVQQGDMRGLMVCGTGVKAELPASMRPPLVH